MWVWQTVMREDNPGWRPGEHARAFCRSAMSDVSSIPLLLDTLSLGASPLPVKLEAAARAGFAGVELRGNDLGGVSGGPAEIADRLDHLGLTRPVLIAEADLHDWHRVAPEARGEFADRAASLLDAAERMSCRDIVFPVMDAEGSLDLTVQNFMFLCTRLGERGLRPILEFIGHVPKVPDLDTAAQVVAAANQPNGGLLIDLYHFYRGASRLEDVRTVPPEKVFLVHLDDATPLPRETLVGMKHRRLPGEGVAPVREVLSILVARGMKPDYAVEVFSEEFWSLGPFEAAVRAHRAARRVLEEATRAPLNDVPRA